MQDQCKDVCLAININRKNSPFENVRILKVVFLDFLFENNFNGIFVGTLKCIF